MQASFGLRSASEVKVARRWERSGVSREKVGRTWDKVALMWRLLAKMDKGQSNMGQGRPNVGTVGKSKTKVGLKGGQLWLRLKCCFAVRECRRDGCRACWS